MRCQKEGCKKDAIAKGYCRTHYRYAKVRARETALKEVIVAIDKLASKKPDLAPMLADITSEARKLYADFQPKRLTPAAEIAGLRAELEDLRRLVKRKPQTQK